MLTSSSDLGDLGWGFRSIGRGLKKAGKVATSGTKSLVKGAVIAPTKIAMKSGVGVVKNTAAVGTNVAHGNVTGVIKSASKVALAPAKLTYDTTKAASKIVTDFALAPLRSKIRTLKSRRAAKLAWDKRGTTAPTVAESAQARKDVKSMLSAKGPHGKMLAWLAGGPMFAGELGVVGYDDAAIAAIATVLTTMAGKIISDAAKSKFAPINAAKEGAAAGVAAIKQTASTAATSAVQKYLPGVAATPAAAAETPVTAPATEPAAAEPVTQEEVAAEPAAQVEEAATEDETAAMEGALAEFGMLSGFADAAEDAAAPASMTETTAKRIASAAQRMVCGMSASALNAIGGLEAVNVASTLCRAAAVGDEAAVRTVLPAVVQIAARASTDFAARATSMGIRQEGGLPNDGFGSWWRTDPFQKINSASGHLFYTDNSDKGRARRAKYIRQHPEQGMLPSEAITPAALNGAPSVSLHDFGMLAAFDGADPEGLMYGLAGVTPDDLAAAGTAQNVSALMLLPMSAVALVGFWLAFRK